MGPAPKSPPSNLLDGVQGAYASSCTGATAQHEPLVMCTPAEQSAKHRTQQTRRMQSNSCCRRFCTCRAAAARCTVQSHSGPCEPCACVKTQLERELCTNKPVARPQAAVCSCVQRAACRVTLPLQAAAAARSSGCGRRRQLPPGPAASRSPAGLPWGRGPPPASAPGAPAARAAAIPPRLKSDIQPRWRGRRRRHK